MSYPAGSEIDVRVHADIEMHQIELRVDEVFFRRKRHPFPYTRAN
jgi:hypothetical protein